MKKVALLILDGFGISDKPLGNAVNSAKMPYYNSLKEKYPYTELFAKGKSVGLLDGKIGNSEVGHLNLGAGKLIKQDLTVITEAIENEEFFTNSALISAFEHAKKNNSDLHLMGLCSNGGVHSDIKHLYALLKLAKMQNFNRVFIHFFTDGRDTAIDSGLGFAEQLIEKMKEIGVGEIASLDGRYYVMDRENNYDRTLIAYDALVNGKGLVEDNIIDAIERNYANNITDEFIIPTIFLKNGVPIATIKDNDAIIFFNFRADRARQIVKALTDKSFNAFHVKNFTNLFITSFTSYGKYPTAVAFPKNEITNTLGEYLAKNGLKQLRIAEETKYAHVTYFFNGGLEKPNENEDRKIFEGVKVAYFDLAPKMRAEDIKNFVIETVTDKNYDFVLINFANPDMLGHTGNFNATVEALEFLDKQLSEVVPHFRKNGFDVILTADHGNAEQCTNEDGSKCTTHTLNNIPFVAVTDKKIKLMTGGRLSNVSPTVVDLIELPMPKDYDQSLIIK